MTKKERTKIIIDHYRGLPGEFYMLKGLICLPGTFGFEGEEKKEREFLYQTFDSMMIAKRMDDISAIERAKLLEEGE